MDIISTSQEQTSDVQRIIPRLKKLYEQVPYFRRALGLTWRAAPGLTLAWGVLLALQSVVPALSLGLSRSLIDQASALLSAPAIHPSAFLLQPLLAPAALLAGILLTGETLRAATSWVHTAQAEALQDHISALVQQQSAALDLAFYDSPDYYDHLHRARWEAGYRPQALLENLGGLLQNGLTLVTLAALLLPYAVWLPLLLLAGALPALIVVLASTLRQHAWRRRVTPLERKAWYYDWLLTDRETAAELRLFGLGDHFQGLYKLLRASLRGEKLSIERGRLLGNLLASLCALLTAGIALAWMGWRLLLGLVTLGDLALFFGAFLKGQSLAGSLLSTAGQVYANSLFLSDLFEFLDLRPHVVEAPHPLPVPAVWQDGLSIRDVTFTYPGSDRPALQNFNLDIPAGQITALLGPNGSGKSTLLKLLCRFYDPDDGAILLDGLDLRCLSLPGLRRAITVLFQEPVHYQDSLHANIALGDLGLQPGDLEGLRRLVRCAATASGADEFAQGLPHGYDTLLGKWFEGGVDLSVGEWQRLALARAFLRASPFIILDEPTSALDPWAEANWLERFRQLARGRTALIITHRLSTAAHADRIHVMQHGRIIESGSHLALMAMNGPYAQSYQAIGKDEEG